MQILVLILFSIGVLLCAIGGLWLLVVMFQKSIWWGISQLVLAGLPGVVFLFKEWRLARVPFMIWFFGLLSMGGAGLMGLPLVGGMGTGMTSEDVAWEATDDPQEQTAPITDAPATDPTTEEGAETGPITSLPPIPEDPEPLDLAEETQESPADPADQATGSGIEPADPAPAQPASAAISDEQRQILQVLRRDPAELQTAQQIKEYAQAIKRQKELLQEQRETLDPTDDKAVQRYRTLSNLLKERARELRDRVQQLKDAQE